MRQGNLPFTFTTETTGTCTRISLPPHGLLRESTEAHFREEVHERGRGDVEASGYARRGRGTPRQRHGDWYSTQTHPGPPDEVPETYLALSGPGRWTLGQPSLYKPTIVYRSSKLEAFLRCKTFTTLYHVFIVSPCLGVSILN